MWSNVSMRRIRSLKGNSTTAKSIFQGVKLVAYHVLLWLVVAGYTIGGGVVFAFMEGPGQVARIKSQVLDAYALELVSGVLAEEVPIQAVLAADSPEEAAMHRVSADAWDIPSSILFAFTIVTTIGYGNISPSTTTSKSFCMIFGLIGIPLTMLAIADMGKFLMEAAGGLYRVLRKSLRRLMWRKGLGAEGGEGGSEESMAWAAFVLLVAFVAYTLGTALIFPLWEDFDLFDSVYFSFITLTTIGLGDIVPQSDRFLMPTLVFLTFGLALTTMAIEVASESFKKLHYMGMRLKNVGKTKIWFGGQKLLVEDLLAAVGRKYGIPQVRELFVYYYEPPPPPVPDTPPPQPYDPIT